MAHKPNKIKTAEADLRARLKTLKLAKPAALGAIPTKLGVRQPAAPMSAAQKTRLANIHAQVRAFHGK